MADKIAAKPGYRDLPVVAIIGRPNVGKSTLFNRLVRGRIAIVDDEPGVTRDRNYKETTWGGKRFFVVDTGGLVVDPSHAIEALVKRQVEAAIEEASLVVFVIDINSGITALDHEIAEMIRKRQKRYILVANKVDTRLGRQQKDQAYELGLGDFIEISAEHGTNIGELLDDIIKHLPQVEVEPEEIASISIVGRPNVGKSSLVNRLAGTEAVIVDTQPGTTRDSIDTVIDTPLGRLRLVDTAGLRRKSRAKTDLERYANLRTIRSIDRSDVVILMLDCGAEIAKQDLTIASYVERSGKGLLIAWNKSDLREEDEKGTLLEAARLRFRHIPYVPVVFISCLTGEGLEELLQLCFEIHAARDTRIPTGPLNRTLIPAITKKPPKTGGRRFPKVYYVAQTGSKPPTFTLFVNDPGLFGDNYLRFIEKQIREIFEFRGCPIRIRVRKSE